MTSGVATAVMAGGAGWGLLYDPELVTDPGPYFVGNLRSGKPAGVAERGRGQVIFVDAPGGGWAVRHYCRGGLYGRLIPDVYAWMGAQRTRCVREWLLLARLRELHLPVPRPVAAAWYRTGLRYTADLVTCRIPGARPLSFWLADGAPVDWHGIGALLWRFHAAGACHADLNAHNILLDENGGTWLLDFDRGRVRRPGPWCARNLARLERSLRKIAARDSAPPFDPVNWRTLTAGYEEARRRASEP